MHAEDDGVQRGGDFFGKPAPRFRQESCLLQARFGRFEYFVVGAGDAVSFLVEGECQIVHGGASDGNEMYVHIPYHIIGSSDKGKIFCPESGKADGEIIIFARVKIKRKWMN